MKDFRLAHHLTLVGEIMAVIERYNGDHGLAARPNELRDTMLTVAGLLHSEAARLTNMDSNRKAVEDSFLEKACESLAKVKWMSSNEKTGFLQ
jgi:hypothetical protein